MLRQSWLAILMLAATTTTVFAKNDREKPSRTGLSEAAMTWTIPAFHGDAINDFPALMRYLVNDSGFNLAINSLTCDKPQEVAVSPDGKYVALSLQDDRFAVPYFRNDCQIVLIGLSQHRNAS